LQYLSTGELEKYKSGKSGIFSITVYAEKPGAKSKAEDKLEKEAACCGADSECC
jgi:hypothetical protein